MESPLMRRLRYKRRHAFIQSYAFPPALEDKLHEKLDTDHQVAVALEGLREWFLACLDAPGRPLGMPSRAVDVAWHEMILMTRAYHAFCERAFGHYLHHNPEAVMDEPMRASLARTLSVVEGQSAAIAGVPLLFAVDRELGLEDGYHWAAEDIAGLRDDRPHRWAHFGSGAGCAGASCGSGGCGSDGDGGGGCGGGGCGGGGCGGGG
jgi:hypothetical protein